MKSRISNAQAGRCYLGEEDLVTSQYDEISVSGKNEVARNLPGEEFANKSAMAIPNLCPGVSILRSMNIRRRQPT